MHTHSLTQCAERSCLSGTAVGYSLIRPVSAACSCGASCKSDPSILSQSVSSQLTCTERARGGGDFRAQRRQGTGGRLRLVSGGYGRPLGVYGSVLSSAVGDVEE